VSTPNTLPPVTGDTKPERAPIGDVFAERVSLLMDKVGSGVARLDEAIERIDESWMAEVEEVVEAEHAKVADEIAAKVVIELATVPLEIDIPGYHNEPTPADLEQERERAEGAMAALTTWEPTEVELADFEERLVALKNHPVPLVTVDPETYETDDDGRGNEPPLSDAHEWRPLPQRIVDATSGEPVTVGFDPTAPERFKILAKQQKIGPQIDAAEATQRLRAPRRKPTPGPRKDDEK
jgi:hypothetical protein